MAATPNISSKFSLFITGVLLMNGILVFIGYYLCSSFNIRWEGLDSINPVTALCFVLSGVWLFFYQLNRKIGRVLHLYIYLFILIMAFFKVLEYAGFSNIAFDRYWFYGILNSDAYFRPLAPNSTFLLALCGITVLLAYRQSPKARRWSDIIKITGFLVSYLAIIGYIFNLEIAYKISGFAPLAVSSAIAYMAFFTVALMVMPAGDLMRIIGSSHVGGRMARRAIPVILLTPLIFGYFKLIGEKDALFDSTYGTALETAFMVLMVLVFVFIYARRLNQQDKIRSQAEQLTRESEKRYRTLVNALREGVVYYDSNGIISFCNQSFSTLTGYREDEIKNTSIFDLFVQHDLRAKFQKRLEDRGSGKIEVYEENIKNRDGQSLWVSVSASPVFNEKGEMIAALSTIVDITERKKQIEDIEAFSASAAHDLNAPLARIEMIALLLIDSSEGQLDAENVELLEAIAGITANMRGLLKDLLQFSKLGVTGINKKEVNTTQMVQEVVAANMHINPRAQVRISALPEIKADKTMIKQVFTNLVTNALKYSSQKETPEVEIGHIQEPGRCVIFVKDNGAGFDMAEASKLFAAFQRLHIEFEGNGMGLPIVKRIIEKHGGTIWAHSIPQEGATFYFTLS